MRNVIFAVGAAIATACGGSAAPASGAVDPGASPTMTVQQFMQAVADSNLTRMAELWGDSRGSAAVTRRPANFQQRVAVMWAYLRGAEGQVLREISSDGGRTVLAVQIDRDRCRWQVPFTMVRTGRGEWLIEAIDLGIVSVPGRPCPADRRLPPG